MSFRALGLSALCLSLYSSGGWGSDLLSFPGERVTAAAGPPASPQVHQAQGLWWLPACSEASHYCWLCPSGPWLPDAGAVFQRPGIREQEALWLPPGCVLSVLEELQGPSSFCPRGKRRPFPLPWARCTGLRSGKLGSERTSGGGAQRPTPNAGGVSGSCATGQARPRTSDGHNCAQHVVTSWIKGSGIQAAFSN